MRKFLNALFGWIVLVSIVGSVIGLITWGVMYDEFYREVQLYEYIEVKEWSKNYPEVKVMAKDAMWNDGIMDRSEFSEIKKMHYKLIKEKVIQDMTGE